MKKFTNDEIKAIRENLENGVVYCGIKNGFGTGRIYISDTSKNIQYEYYGSSAMKDTERNLRWILETVFDDCETITPAEWSDYHLDYIPIDKQYKAIDCSLSHPNVCGK